MLNNSSSAILDILESSKTGSVVTLLVEEAGLDRLESHDSE